MPSRLRPIAHSLQFLHDGDTVQAEVGESLAHGLLAAGRQALTRSPKLHRPRGPYCLRGACEGCLVRVDGVPNVMACRHRLTGGERVETQNVLGSRRLDLLAASDFLFPHGVDHHRLLAGIPGVSGVVQRLARRIAGLGRLPDESRDVRATERREVPLLIVGGGAAGLSLAEQLGPRATLVDDGLALGGGLDCVAPKTAAALIERARHTGAELLSNTTAAGIYFGPQGSSGPLQVLLASQGSAALWTCRTLVLAMGEHDAVPDFPGNDLPGILSARAGLSLLRGGILPGQRVALVGAGRFAERAAELLGKHLVLRVPEPDHVLRAEGRLGIRRLILRKPQELRRVAVDCLLFDGPGAPAFELAVQAGGCVNFNAQRGYTLDLDASDRAAPGVYCIGRLAGHEDSFESAGAFARRLEPSLSAR